MQAAALIEPALDLTVKTDPAGWAQRLGGLLLPTGSVRLSNNGRIAEIEGYESGAWWVQDAAAALPVKCLGDIRGLKVLDMCAAPRRQNRPAHQRRCRSHFSGHFRNPSEKTA